MGQQDKKLQQMDNDILTALTKVPKPAFQEIASETLNASGTSPLQKTKKLLMWLIVASPSNVRGTVLPISSGAIIGRHGDIIWHDAHMSRKHAQFHIVDDPNDSEQKQFAITPYKDRNGTFVNGQRITENTPLSENDVIVMGDTQFIVKTLL